MTVRLKVLRRARLRLVGILSLCPRQYLPSWGLFRPQSLKRGHSTPHFREPLASQRSLLRSAVFINFCLLRMICSVSCDKLRTWKGSSELVFIPQMRPSSFVFTSNCFLLPLDLNRPFYSCLLSYLVFECKRDWGDLALIQTSVLFSFKCHLVSIRTTWKKTKTLRSLTKQDHLQPHCHSKARSLDRQLKNGLFWGGPLCFRLICYQLSLGFELCIEISLK